MIRIARTHKEMVRPNYDTAERPDLIEEEENASSTPGKEAAEASVGNEASQDQSQEGSEVLYNNKLGSEMPQDEGVQEPATPPDLLIVDFGQLPSSATSLVRPQRTR